MNPAYAKLPIKHLPFMARVFVIYQNYQTPEVLYECETMSDLQEKFNRYRANAMKKEGVIDCELVFPIETNAV